MTVLHALAWPLACVCGWAAAAAAKRRGFSMVEAYALALVPGVLLALASAVFGPASPAPNEQPWQALLLWAAWSLVGLRIRPRQSRPVTTLNLSGRERV